MMRSEEEREVPQQKQKPQHNVGKKIMMSAAWGGKNHVSHFSWHAQYLVRLKGDSSCSAQCE